MKIVEDSREVAKPQELQDEPAFFFRFEQFSEECCHREAGWRNYLGESRGSRTFQPMSARQFVPGRLRLILIKRVRHAGRPFRKTLSPGIIKSSLVPEGIELEIVSVPPERVARSRIPCSPK
jgi:hypothetical protein